MHTVKLAGRSGFRRKYHYWHKAVVENAEAPPHGQAFPSISAQQALPLSKTNALVR
jgi:hypothetical protein